MRSTASSNVNFYAVDNNCTTISHRSEKQNIMFFVIFNSQQVSFEQQVPIGDVRKEATAILEELGHTFSMGKVRGFAYVLIKVFKALFKRIYVNDEGIQTVRATFLSLWSNIQVCCS